MKNMQDSIQNEMLNKFDFLQTMPDDERKYFLDSLIYRQVPAGTLMIEENATCTGVAFVLSGEFKAFKISENGREISIFSVKSGDTCVLTIACLLGFHERRSPLSISSIQDSRIAVLPTDSFSYIYAQSPQLQQYIFRNIMSKFYDILALVEKLTFKSVGERLTEYLEKNTSGGKKPIYLTHSQLAAKLGTSREVVTRKLGELESEGIVKTERGKITLVAHAR